MQEGAAHRRCGDEATCKTIPNPVSLIDTSTSQAVAKMSNPLRVRGEGKSIGRTVACHSPYD